MAAMPSFRMPFERVPCKVWFPVEPAQPDSYGNVPVTYATQPDWEGECCYSPFKGSSTRTDDDIEQGRPNGDEVTMYFYLPKTFDHSLRKAKIAAYPDDDSMVYGREFYVIGEPFSAHRPNTPGDFSWEVRAGDHVG